MFAWDEAKRRANLKKHGINFVDAERSLAESLSLQRILARPMENGGFLHWAFYKIRSCRLRIPSVVTTFVSFLFARPRNMKRATTSRKSSTNLSRVRRMIDVDIVRDRDAPEWTPEMFARAVARKGLKPVPKKALLSLRIDSDVIEWFKKQGAGYQSRMNALLRAYMEAHK
jgi:uncharacterized protein (DUF4415 family)/uncharacterized DUF497 family protein